MLDRLGKTYPNKTTAVDELTLDVAGGDVTVLIGPSGCGKSTVLRMVNRLIEPTRGRVLVDGEDVTKVDPVRLRRTIGYVIQNVGLFPHQTVRANVGTVPRMLGWDKARIAGRTDELLDLVGLEPGRYAARYPHELSGGQRQRVGFARALAADPVVLLMDEPFSAVDPINRGRLQDEFLRLRQSVRKTTILVTHDLQEAIKLGDRIAVLSDHARLEQYATPAELLANPANAFVEQFIGEDRGIMRLSVTPIPRDRLQPLHGAPGDLPTVPAGGTLRVAFGAMLAAGAAAAVVRDGDEPIGVLSAADVQAALADVDAAPR
ncbi:ABC transporter ATP-binding protein [Dactylosporangium aurantiacum]|uniref:ABC-type quaternary amine transporter n=1 Tax=Dactylosporangium aurantiacum TaxID=35754 RepID=A0A9Q9ITT8_9ACTN|nr:ABC transporter ATP-binding protein [Dactylosporangium aurantiacum]MDG6100707.1 ABC transporter ATP-binding protein [Dactylosporangium aurantiacum]UWZ59310.1 ABC transporter ATP-binding protein [Dactylosporangium aurantiacum]